MKKVAFLCCLFCGLITQAVGATYNCKPQSLGPLAFKSSNEYLFPNVYDRNRKIALVCGHKGTDGCEHGTIVNAHSHHYYGDVEIEHAQLYRCDTSGGASWETMALAELDKCANIYGLKHIPLAELGDYYLFVPRTGLKVDELYYTALDEEPCYVWLGDDDSSPATSEGKKAATTNASEKKPAQGAKQNQSAQNQSGDVGEKSEKKPAQDTKQNQPVQNQSGDAEKKSKEKSGQGAKQNQSGDAGKKAEGKWREPCSQEDLLKVPHAKAGRYIFKNEKEGITCAATECVAGYYLVKNAEGQSQGWCKYGTDPYATTNASETKPAQETGSSNTSGTGTTGADATGTGTSGTGTSAQNQSIDTGTSLKQSQTSRVRALTQKIESAASQLDSMSSRFKVSGWKDAEGKFNTARLASDSIAGVVLGTAGGLITSHVVKKNQVENGFQDIKCTIGGQSVANWGDEFSVGIQ